MSTVRMLARAAGDTVNVKALIQHPMDSGFVKGSDGKLIPAHYIETVDFKVNGKLLFVCDWGPAVSKDPFVSFKYKGKKGDKIDVQWKDNEGKSDTGSATVM